MRIKRTARQTWRLVNAALVGALLIAIAGCVNITIKVMQTGRPQPGLSEPQRRLQPHPVPDDSSGNLVPVQGALASGTETTVCGNPVSGTKVIFSFTTNGQTLLWQTNPPGSTGFRGTVIDLDNNSQAIANTDYYLQLFVNSIKNGCCTNVAGSGTEVGRGIWTGTYGYRFTAFFKTGHVPPISHQIQLQGIWTP